MGNDRGDGRMERGSRVTHGHGKRARGAGWTGALIAVYAALRHKASAPQIPTSSQTIRVRHMQLRFACAGDHNHTSSNPTSPHKQIHKQRNCSYLFSSLRASTSVSSRARTALVRAFSWPAM